MSSWRTLSEFCSRTLCDPCSYRDLLRNYNSKMPIHFGHRFKYLGVGHVTWAESERIFKGYMAGGSGYVLSKVSTNSWIPDILTVDTSKKNFLPNLFPRVLLKCLRRRWKQEKSASTRVLNGAARTSGWVRDLSRIKMFSDKLQFETFRVQGCI